MKILYSSGEFVEKDSFTASEFSEESIEEPTSEQWLSTTTNLLDSNLVRMSYERVKNIDVSQIVAQ